MEQLTRTMMELIASEVWRQAIDPVDAAAG